MTLIHNASNDNEVKYLHFKLDQYNFALPVSNIQDVLFPQKITKIPLAPTFVCGAFNLRGRIVTVYDICEILGIGDTKNTEKCMLIVLEEKDEYICFPAETANKVLSISSQDIRPTPGNLSSDIEEILRGIYREDNSLVLVINEDKLSAKINEQVMR